MAIKGSLSDISFVELLRIVGAHDGRLKIWNFADHKQYECVFFDQSVIYLNFCGELITTRDAVKDAFLDLLTDDHSLYDFQREAAVCMNCPPIVSVAELLDFSVFETPEADESFLPHIDTKFETVNKFDFVLQGELSSFWRDSIGFLHRGCSGFDLCVELGLEERLVRQNLYKLRTTGLIKPVRLFGAAALPAPPRGASSSWPEIAGDEPQFVSTVHEKAPSAPSQRLAPRRDDEFFVAGTTGPGTATPRPSLAERDRRLSDEIVPPDFLLKQEPSLPMPDAGALSGNFGQPPARAAKIEAPHESKEFWSAASSAGRPADGAFPARFAETSAISGEPAAVVAGPPDVGREPAAPPRRASLLKRMLKSLFRD